MSYRNLIKSFYPINYLILNLILSIYFVVTFNLQTISNLSNNVLDILGLSAILVVAFNLIFLLFSFVWIQKFILGGLLLIGSLVSYATSQYGIEFDRVMIQNICETNQKELFEYFNIKVLSWVLITGIIPMILLSYCKIKYPTSMIKGLIQRGGCGFICMLMIFIAALINKEDITLKRYNKTIRDKIVPISFIYNSVRYIKYIYFVSNKPFTQIGKDAKENRPSSTKPTLLVIVVGESARSKNYSLNGYDRPTNFFTEKLSNLISFKNTTSCSTSTGISLPCMFSNMTRESYKQNIAKNQSNLLDVLTYAGISVLWKNSHQGCKGVCTNVPTINILNKKYYQDGICYDEKLLENFEQEIKKEKSSHVIVLHLIGSHGPLYYSRYPQNHNFFMPICTRKDVENCTKEELINVYDNTLRYTDYVLAKLVNKLKELHTEFNTVMIYASDHGESLGENGIYFHGMPYAVAPKEQIEIPFIIWYSDELQKSKHLDSNCLYKNSTEQYYSHDNLFHSVLGVMDVETKEYDSKLDIFAPCRGHNTKTYHSNH